MTRADRTRDLRRLAASAIILGLIGAAAVAGPAAGQAATTGASPSPVPSPSLTWAPLVTLPPIVTPSSMTPVELADGVALGAETAPVTVEVWEDFQCPFCQRWTLLVKPELVERYVRDGRVRLVFRNLAFLGDESHWAAVAASLAADQGRFWPYHDYLFANLLGENVGSYSLERLLAIASAVGLEMGPFRSGLALEAARERFATLDRESRAAAAALGIDATPTVVVDGIPLDSPDLESISAAIEAALERAGPGPVATPTG